MTLNQVINYSAAIGSVTALLSWSMYTSTNSDSSLIATIVGVSVATFSSISRLALGVWNQASINSTVEPSGTVSTP